MFFFSLSVSHKNYWMCADDLDEKKNAKLKVILEDYFQDQTDFKAVVENTKEEVSANNNYMSSVVLITTNLSKNNVSFAASQPMNCFHDYGVVINNVSSVSAWDFRCEKWI